MDKVCHFEVPYEDKERMEKFYQAVFGWQFHTAPGEMPYTFAITTEIDESMRPKETGGINGGTYPRGDEGGSKSPVIVIEVESCEQRVKDVKEAGGSAVVGPMQVGDMGILHQPILLDADHGLRLPSGKTRQPLCRQLTADCLYQRHGHQHG